MIWTKIYETWRLLNKHFCKNIFQIYPLRQKQLSIFTFNYNSMESISCHSNQSSNPTRIKNNLCRGQCPKHVCQVSASSHLWFLKKKFFNSFRKFTLHGNQSNKDIKLSYLDRSHMKHGGLLNKHICEKKIQISPIRNCLFLLSPL